MNVYTTDMYIVKEQCAKDCDLQSLIKGNVKDYDL